MSLRSSEDYKKLFEIFLQTAGIKYQEFMEFMQKERAYCSKVHKNEQGECNGIYLAETKYVLLETLKTPDLRMSKEEVEGILSKEEARLPTEDELKRFDTWKQSFRCVIAKEKGKDGENPQIFVSEVPITAENYWTCDNFSQSSKQDKRYLMAIKDEKGATSEMIFFARLYQEFFKEYFEY